MPKRKLSDKEISCPDSGSSAVNHDEQNPEEKAAKRKQSTVAVLDSLCEQVVRKDSNSEDLSPPRRKQVRFDGITLFYFERSQGYSSIPTHGGSTIGMADKHHTVRHLTLQQHEKEILCQRYGGGAINSSSSGISSIEDETGVTPTCGNEETTENKTSSIGSESLEESSPSSAEDDCGDEDDNENDCAFSASNETEDGYFLQPLGSRQRKLLLKAAGVTDIDKNEREELKQIRKSREVCGCDCKEKCLPETCHCAQNDIKCQVDRLSFPCGCTKDGCGNPTGRVEFNPVRVRSHYLNTMMRLKLEERRGDIETPSPSHIRFTNEDSYCESATSDDATYASSNMFQKQLLRRQPSIGYITNGSSSIQTTIPRLHDAVFFPRFESVFGSGRGGSSYTLLSPQHPLPTVSSYNLPSTPAICDNNSYKQVHHQQSDAFSHVDERWSSNDSFERAPAFLGSSQHSIHGSTSPAQDSSNTNLPYSIAKASNEQQLGSNEVPSAGSPQHTISSVGRAYYSPATSSGREGLKAVAQFCSSYDFSYYNQAHQAKSLTTSQSVEADFCGSDHVGNHDHHNGFYVSHNSFSSNNINGIKSNVGGNGYFMSSEFHYNESGIKQSVDPNEERAEKATGNQSDKPCRSSKAPDVNTTSVNNTKSSLEIEVDRGEALFSSYAFAEAVLATVASSPESADTSTDSGFEDCLLTAEPIVFASNVQSGTTSIGHWSTVEHLDGRRLSSLYPHMQTTNSAVADNNTFASTYCPKLHTLFPFGSGASDSLSNSSTNSSSTIDDSFALSDEALELLNDSSSSDDPDPSGWLIRSHGPSKSVSVNGAISSHQNSMSVCVKFDSRNQEQLGTVLKESICETALA